MKRLVALCLVLVAAPVSAGGNMVWRVDDDLGPGVDFAEVQAAVDAAGSGDLVLVSAGTYDGFVVDGKELVVVAEAGAEVVIGGGGVEVRSLGNAQHFVLRGVQVSTSGGFDFALFPSVEVAGCAGPVWFEDCELDGRTVHVESSASVVLARCVLRGRAELTLMLQVVPSPGLTVVDAGVDLFGCEVFGSVGDGQGHSILPCFDGLAGGAGVRVQSGVVALSGCRVVGGEGGDGTDVPSVVSTGDGTDGGDAVLLETVGASVRLVDTVLEAGAGGPSAFPCVAGAPGMDVAGVGSAVAIAGAARSVRIDAPIVENGSANLVLEGEPGDVVFLGLAAEPWPRLELVGVTGALLALPVVPAVFVGVLPAGGELSSVVTTGVLPVGVEFGAAYLQGGFLGGGGEVVLGGVSVAVVVSASV